MKVDFYHVHLSSVSGLTLQSLHSHHLGAHLTLPGYLGASWWSRSSQDQRRRSPVRPLAALNLATLMNPSHAAEGTPYQPWPQVAHHYIHHSV